jgi:hypothetical protein
MRFCEGRCKGTKEGAIWITHLFLSWSLSSSSLFTYSLLFFRTFGHSSALATDVVILCWIFQILPPFQFLLVCAFRPLLVSKVKVKLSLCFDWAPRHKGVLEAWMYSSTHYLTSALDGGEWLASFPGRFTPKERAPGAHWIGGWVGSRALLDAVMKRRIRSPCRDSNPPIIQPLAQLSRLLQYFSWNELLLWARVA